MHGCWRAAILAAVVVVGCGSGQGQIAAVTPATDEAPDREPAAPADAGPRLDPDEPEGPFAFQWARSFSGPSYSAGWGTALNADGSLVVTGAFENSIDLDPGPDLEEHMASGDLDVFVVTFEESGDYRWGVTLGGGGEDSAREVAARPDGSIAVAGCFYTTVDFDPGPGEDFRSSVGEADAFVTVLDRSGGEVWTRTFGGTGVDCALRIEARADGSLIVAGGFDGTTDFDPGPGVDSHTTAGEFDAFVVALSADGALLWTRTIGGPREEIAAGLDVATDGSVLVGGWFNDTADLDPGPGTVQATATSPDFPDAYVVSLAADGSTNWARSFGGPEADKVIALAVGPDGSVTLTGSFDMTADLDPGPPVRLFDAKGSSGAFVLQLDARGSYRWAQSFGDAPVNDGIGIVSLPDGSVLAALQGRPFLVQLGTNGMPGWSWSSHVEDGCEAWSTSATPDGAVSIVGVFRNPVAFDASRGITLSRDDNNVEPNAFALRLEARP